MENGAPELFIELFLTNYRKQNKITYTILSPNYILQTSLEYNINNYDDEILIIAIIESFTNDISKLIYICNKINNNKISLLSAAFIYKLFNYLIYSYTYVKDENIYGYLLNVINYSVKYARELFEVDISDKEFIRAINSKFNDTFNDIPILYTISLITQTIRDIWRQKQYYWNHISSNSDISLTEPRRILLECLNIVIFKTQEKNVLPEYLSYYLTKYDTYHI